MAIFNSYIKLPEGTLRHWGPMSRHGPSGLFAVQWTGRLGQRGGEYARGRSAGRWGNIEEWQQTWGFNHVKMMIKPSKMGFSGIYLSKIEI